MSRKSWHAIKLESRTLAPETLMMGYGYDPHLSERSLKPPLFLTSTFVFSSAEDGKAFFELAYGLRQKRPNEEPGLIYSRINNPDLEMLEDRLAIWDEAEGSLVFASGMAAISTTWAYARPDTAILHSDPIYGGTDFLLKKILPQFGVYPVAFSAEGGVAAMQIAAKKAQKLGSVAAIYVETPANPTNGIVDIAAARVLAEHLATDGRRLPLIVDNTFLGPLYQTPLALGADIVVASLTKYVGGHSDLIAGGCSGSEAMLQPIRGMRTILGSMCDPHTGWLLMRSLETSESQNDSIIARGGTSSQFSGGSSKGRLGLVSRLPTESTSRSRSVRTPMQGARLDVQLRSQRRRGRGVFRPQSAKSD